MFGFELRNDNHIFGHRKDDYAFFLTPVDTSKVPGYTDVVKRPMDFGTMTTKISKGKYRSLEEFAVSDLFFKCFLIKADAINGTSVGFSPSHRQRESI